MDWMLASEVKESGEYLINRTDEPMTSGPVNLVEFKGLYYVVEAGKIRMDSPITEWDCQTRFFGPIPELKEVIG